MHAPTLTVLTFFFLAVATAAALPPEAVELVRSLPNGKLPLSYVVQYAMKTSDSYRALRSDLETSDVARQSMDGRFATTLRARVGWQDDRREPQIVFSPNQVKGSDFSLGVSKLFATGTSLDFELKHSTSSINFTTIPATSFAETKATVGLRQNLWRDAFGASSRAALQAADQATNVNRAAYRDNRQSWFLELAQLYYTSWIAQQELSAAEQSRVRRGRLLKIMQVREGRGTAEKPDVLQVQAALANANVNVSRAQYSLGERWRLLVSSLKLSPAIADIDARQVPLVLDSPEIEARNRCSDANAPGKSSPALERAKLATEAARSSLARAESDNKPDLDLLVNLGVNAIAPSSDQSLSEIASAQNPLIGAGVELTIPLGLDASEAERRLAAKDLLKAEASQGIAQDNWSLAWQNGCRDLTRLIEARELLTDALARQTEREKLEENRFQLGRGTTLQVIQAGDDVSAAQQALWSTEVQLRLAAWRLDGLNGQLDTTLAGLEPKSN